jgi:alpha-L-fucosidase 2
MNKFRICILSILCVHYFGLCAQPVVKIDWPSFLKQHDLVFESLPQQWNEGAFVGNGQVGMMLYVKPQKNQIVFHLGRQDVTDHRKAPDKKTSRGVTDANVMYDFPRLDIGLMVLQPVGKIVSGELRQDLWNAEIRGTILTNLGKIVIRAYTPYTKMLNVVEVSSTEKMNGKWVKYSWHFLPGNPASPRAQVFPKNDTTYVTNPKPVQSIDHAIHSTVQTLLAGGDYATSWMELKTGQSRSTLLVSTSNEVPNVDKSIEVAKRTILNASKDKAKIELSHRAWWHSFYQKSFLSIPDARMESFYWIQLYKMASCSRPDGPALDLFGPFFRVSQWPGLWWNLNVQLTYWNVLQSNHLELGENLISLIDEQFESMIKVFDSQKLGDFTWVMHNYWLQLRYTGNWERIKDKWLPKAERISKLYEKRLIRNGNGQLEMLPMESPEYDGFKTYTNSNYNLALYRWLLTAMMECTRENKLDKPEFPHWEQLLKELMPFPINENGLMIGSEQAVDKSHRHYSHLLGLYPLFVLNPDLPSDRTLVDKSVLHWHKIGDGKGLAGYSYTGAASLYAALGRGNDAEATLNRFLLGKIGISQLLSNTFYVEVSGKNPVIETPLSAANSISELLLQSWGGKIRLFPAMPDKWKEASIDKLRTQGGFLVSASYKNGKTEWVSVKSLAGEPCVLIIPGWTKAFHWKKSKPVEISVLPNSSFVVDIKINEEILLFPNNSCNKAVLNALPHNTDDLNLYGVKKGKNLGADQSWELPEYLIKSND